MKGGESLGDEESSKEEEEVVPALILASGARPLAPDVKSLDRSPHVMNHLACSGETASRIPLKRIEVRRPGVPPAMQIVVQPWRSVVRARQLVPQR